MFSVDFANVVGFPANESREQQKMVVYASHHSRGLVTMNGSGGNARPGQEIYL
jgi:hypothetical protein